MKIISIANQKGGCGKTTTAVNLSWALSEENFKTILIDFDPQAHATFSLNINAPSATITDIIEAFIREKKVTVNEAAVPRGDNFYTIPSSIGLSAVEQQLSIRSGNIGLLRDILLNLNELDYCVIDAPPNLGPLTLNALSASDYVIIPLGMCNFSLKGTKTLTEILQMLKDFNGRSPEIFYLLTQFDRRSKFAHRFLETIKTNLGDSLLKTIIRNNITLREAASLGKTVFEHNRKSRGAEDYRDLALELKTKLKKSKDISSFSIEGAHLKDVYVVGDFTQWQIKEEFKLNRGENGTWHINLPLKKGVYRYKFSSEGRWFNDPRNNITESDPFGGKNSILTVR